MTLPAILEDFPIGCAVKVVRFPRHFWKSPRVLGAVGIVVGHLDEEGEYWLDVHFPGTPNTEIFRPWWVERGHAVWIPCARS